MELYTEPSKYSIDVTIFDTRRIDDHFTVGDGEEYGLDLVTDDGVRGFMVAQLGDNGVFHIDYIRGQLGAKNYLDLRRKLMHMFPTATSMVAERISGARRINSNVSPKYPFLSPTTTTKFNEIHNYSITDIIPEKSRRGVNEFGPYTFVRYKIVTDDDDDELDEISESFWSKRYPKPKKHTILEVEVGDNGVATIGLVYGEIGARNFMDLRNKLKSMWPHVTTIKASRISGAKHTNTGRNPNYMLKLSEYQSNNVYNYGFIRKAIVASGAVATIGIAALLTKNVILPYKQLYAVVQKLNILDNQYKAELFDKGNYVIKAIKIMDEGGISPVTSGKIMGEWASKNTFKEYYRSFEPPADGYPMHVTFKFYIGDPMIRYRAEVEMVASVVNNEFDFMNDLETFSGEVMNGIRNGRYDKEIHGPHDEYRFGIIADIINNESDHSRLDLVNTQLKFSESTIDTINTSVVPYNYKQTRAGGPY